jgi:hypothetical protein
MKNDFNKLPVTLRYSIYAGAGLIVFFVGRKIIKDITTKVKLKKVLKDQEDSVVKVTIIDQGSGTGVTTNLNLSLIAGTIYDSFYNNDFFDWTEDETRAIDELKKVPKQYIPQLSQIYSDTYQKNLQNDFIEFCDSDEMEKIDYLFN